MKEYRDIESFFHMGNVAQIYIDKSFEDLNLSLENEFRKHLINPNELTYTKGDEEQYNVYLEAVKAPISFLRKPLNSITSNTFNSFSKIRAEAALKAKNGRHKFKKNFLIEDYFILSHVTNLALFVEIIVNRHLYFLLKIEVFDRFVYNQIEKASVLNKILFIMRGKEISLNRISRLFTLRNFAVHYTSDNTHAFNVTIEELIGIWNEVKNLVDKLHEVEQFDEDFIDVIEVHIEEFHERWG